MEVCARKECGKSLFNVTRYVLDTRFGKKVLCSEECYVSEMEDEAKREQFVLRLTVHNFNGA